MTLTPLLRDELYMGEFTQNATYFSYTDKRYHCTEQAIEKEIT